jgi:hypothetical protein
MLSRRANAAAETVEAFVRMCRCEPSLAYLSSKTYRLCVKVEAFDLAEDCTELDVVGAVSGDFSVEPPVVEIENSLLHGAEQSGVSE